ncbi:hypothetical protein [Neotamlana laminarinivorans]|nr:hypothetical protein [Tamlana laminarinivorans]
MIFFAIFIPMVIIGKRHLYVHEHEASIRKEINKFDETIKTIDVITTKSDFTISKDHLY